LTAAKNNNETSISLTHALSFQIICCLTARVDYLKSDLEWPLSDNLIDTFGCSDFRFPQLVSVASCVFMSYLFNITDIWLQVLAEPSSESDLHKRDPLGWSIV
jgi:hypothetical protein